MILSALNLKWHLAIFDLSPEFLQSKKHANKVKRYLAIHGMETLKGEPKRLDPEQVTQLPCGERSPPHAACKQVGVVEECGPQRQADSARESPLCVTRRVLGHL